MRSLPKVIPPSSSPPGTLGPLAGAVEKPVRSCDSLRVSRRLTPPRASFLLLALLAACGHEPSGAVPVHGSPSQAERAEMKKQVEAQLRAELTPRIRSEVRAELSDEIRAQLEAEAKHPQGTQPTRAVTSVAPPTEPRHPDSPDAAPSEPVASDPPVDGEPAWARPGTVIQPWHSGPKLLEVAVGTGLEDKSPTDVQLHYDAVPELLYCYTLFENPAPETTITHVWRRGTRLVSRVELEVGNSPKWKTWSKQRTQPHWTGTWSCEVLGPDGQQLGSTAFQVGPAQ